MADLGGSICCSDNSSPVVVNSILMSLSAWEVWFMPSNRPNSITVAYADIQGGEGGIAINDNGVINSAGPIIDLDPLFIDPSNDDFHLLSESPCIDAGCAFFVLEGDTLVNLAPEEYSSLAPDMGAYEHDYDPTQVDPASSAPSLQFKLLQNYPNPFNPVTTIKFAIPPDFPLTMAARHVVSLQIYDISGRLIKTLIDNLPFEPGYHSIQWDGRNRDGAAVGSGVYICRLEVNSPLKKRSRGAVIATRRMILLK
ncbi:MAG: hypothetical protein GY869_17740 [Planctomycetes bacterium]|nr:hypothetical protein [Planctomycetota bacterium]